MIDLAREIIATQPILAVFLAIGLGYLVGQINLGGFSLGVGAVLFVGLAIGAKGVSVWLRAEFDVLMKRIRRRHDRPLLKTADPAATLRKLIEEREPVYALADLTVQSREVTHDKIVDEIVSALAGHVGAPCSGSPAPGGGGRVP